jgi:tRNA threonylcarbamoyladenosine biosynthesis protein TsaB
VNIIAIETATETIGVAVRAGSGAQAMFTLQGRRRHVETLAPAVEHLLGQVGLTMADLDVVAVDLGPGLFTGLRVGIAAAKGMAQALGIGVVGLSSLDILTRAAAGHGHTGYVLAAVDARRGEVFATVRDVGASDEHGVTLPPGLFGPDQLAAALAALRGAPVVAVGDGAQRYADILTAVRGVSCVTDALGAPPASTLLAMVAEHLAAGVSPDEPRSVVPLYMREADATSNFVQVTPT